MSVSAARHWSLSSEFHDGARVRLNGRVPSVTISSDSTSSGDRCTGRIQCGRMFPDNCRLSGKNNISDRVAQLRRKQKCRLQYRSNRRRPNPFPANIETLASYRVIIVPSMLAKFPLHAFLPPTPLLWQCEPTTAAATCLHPSQACD